MSVKFDQTAASQLLTVFRPLMQQVQDENAASKVFKETFCRGCPMPADPSQQEAIQTAYGAYKKLLMLSMNTIKEALKDVEPTVREMHTVFKASSAQGEINPEQLTQFARVVQVFLLAAAEARTACALSLDAAWRNILVLSQRN